MKTKLIITLIISICYINLNAQDFYYSAGKKNYIKIDSTTIIAKIKQSVDQELFTNNFSKKIDIERIHKFKNKSIFELKYKKKVSNALIDENIEKCMYGYKFDDIPFYLTGEILLQPKEGININKILEYVEDSLYVIKKTKYNTFKIGVGDWSKILTIANKIYESDLVEYCHPNFIAEIQKLQTDPLYPDQYILDNTGQFGGTENIDISIEEAWDLTTGLTRTRVAVIDDGVEAHEDLAGRILQGFTPTDPNGFGAPTNPLPPVNLMRIGHGQACAGIIAASHNNIGIAGVSPCSDIIPINIFNDWINQNNRITFLEDAFDVGAAIDFAWDEGQADVISNSWSYTTTSSGNVPNADEIIKAIGRARSQGRNLLGSIVVFASGNSNQSFSGVTFPANVEGVVTVGAIDNRGNIWNYSSRGPEMDLVTPSGNVNLLGNVVTTDRMGANGYDPGNYIDNFGGTSAACPHVSGVASLMLSANPNLTETEVVNILRSTADDMGTSGFDNTFGYGRLDARRALLESINRIEIEGNPIVCASEVYRIKDLPAGCSVTWALSPSGGPYPSLTQNSPNTNECTISNPYRYPITLTLTATISSNTGCGNSITITRQIISDSQNQIQYGSYYQQPCYFYGVYHPSLSGSLPTTLGVPVFVHQGCMTEVTLSNMTGRTVSFSGPTQPLYWYYNNSGKLYFQLPYGSGGIPFTFKIVGDGACVEKSILFFSYSNNSNATSSSYSIEISPNPVNDVLTVTVEQNTEVTDEVEILTTEDLISNMDNSQVEKEIEYSIKVFNIQQNTLVIDEPNIKGRSKYEINVSNLQNGMYLLQVIKKDEVQTIKFLKE